VIGPTKSFKEMREETKDVYPMRLDKRVLRLAIW